MEFRIPTPEACQREAGGRARNERYHRRAIGVQNPHAGGVTASSRWSSEGRAIPPETDPSFGSHPGGMPASVVRAFDFPQPALSHCLFDQGPVSLHRRRMALSSSRVPWWNGKWARGEIGRGGWNRRSPSPSGQPEVDSPPRRFFERFEKIGILVGAEGDRCVEIRVAGGIRSIHGEPDRVRGGEELHPKSGRASPHKDVSRRTRGVS